MVTAAIISGVLSLLGILLTTFSNTQSVRETNETNMQMQREANETNIMLSRQTNAANAAQANLAYERSLPVNQLAQLTSSGMSKSAALAKLQGGSYIAAPQTSANVGASQNIPAAFDFSQLGNIAANSTQVAQNIESIDRQKIETANLISQEQREKDKHDFAMWNMQYGKDSATAYDSLGNEISDLIRSKGIAYKELNSKKDFEDKLQLHENDLWRNAPESVKQRLVNDVVSSKDALIKDANLVNLLDSHEKHAFEMSLNDIRKRKVLSEAQYSELQADLAQLNVDEFPTLSKLNVKKLIQEIENMELQGINYLNENTISGVSARLALDREDLVKLDNEFARLKKGNSLVRHDLSWQNPLGSFGGTLLRGLSSTLEDVLPIAPLLQILK